MKKIFIFLFLSVLSLAGWFAREQALEVFGVWNGFYANGGESLLTLLGILAGGAGLYYWVLPDYIAVAFHDGEKWLGVTTMWSTRKDFELFGKAEAGILFGRFVKENEVRIPRIPRPRFYKLVLFGGQRGIYRVMPIRLLPDGIEVLEKEKSLERTDRPKFAFQMEDEGLKLK